MPKSACRNNAHSRYAAEDPDFSKEVRKSRKLIGFLLSFVPYAFDSYFLDVGFGVRVVVRITLDLLPVHLVLAVFFFGLHM
jgi:hypothetical protein